MPIVKFFAALLCLIALAACGNKGPVRPLKIAAPDAIKAPELRQQGDALLLGWQLPSSNQDGSPLAKPPVVDIYRMTYDPTDDCPECFDRSTLLVSINPQLPAPAQQVGKRYLLHDRPLLAGTGYQYKLIARNQDDEQSQPVILRQAYNEPVAAPQQVIAIPRDRSVLLQWQTAPLAEGDSLLGYLVYRRLDSEESLYPLTKQPLPETQFEDFNLDNDTRYHYRVRVLIQRGRQKIEGLASPELSTTPKAGI